MRRPRRIFPSHPGRAVAQPATRRRPHLLRRGRRNHRQANFGFRVKSFRLRIRVIQNFSGSQPLLAGRETISCGCILRALCQNPGARPSWPQHIRRPIRRPEKLLIMAWPVSRRDCCGRDARAPFGLGNTAHTTRRNPFLFTFLALPWLIVTACSLFGTS
jgi:hypothetical protein